MTPTAARRWGHMATRTDRATPRTALAPVATPGTRSHSRPRGRGPRHRARTTTRRNPAVRPPPIGTDRWPAHIGGYEGRGRTTRSVRCPSAAGRTARVHRLFAESPHGHDRLPAPRGHASRRGPGHPG